MKWIVKARLAWARVLLWLGMSRGVYYIGKADTLPPPLSAEEEAELIANLDADKRFRSVLVERNLRLVVYIAKKFENTGIGMEDLISMMLDDHAQDRQMEDLVNLVADKARELAAELGRKVTPMELAGEGEVTAEQIEEAVRLTGGRIEDLDVQPL